MAKVSDEFDYRAKSVELTSILEKLQNADIQIDQATKLHAQGLKLAAEIETYLTQAENEIQKNSSDG